MARPERFELPASWFVAMRSIQLSYGRAVQAETERKVYRSTPRGRAIIWKPKNPVKKAPAAHRDLALRLPLPSRLMQNAQPE